MNKQQPDLLSKLCTLAWRADVQKDAEARQEIADLCRQHPFLARHRNRMIKERQELKWASFPAELLVPPRGEFPALTRRKPLVR